MLPDFLIDHPEHGPGIAKLVLTDPPASPPWWSLRLDAGGTVRIQATQDQISEWTNARARREQEDASMDAPTTINIRPTASLVEAAFEHFGIELGRALSLRPDGYFTIDPDARDFPEALSKLTGQVLADYTTATIVLPSNAQALKAIRSDLRHLPVLDAEASATLTELVERLDSVIDNLDGLMGSQKS